MKTVFSAMCSSDYFQHYIPLYYYTVNKAYPECDVAIGVFGELDNITTDALTKCMDQGHCKNIIITENTLFQTEIKDSTISTARFLPAQKTNTLTTDIDMLVLPTNPTLIDWAMEQMTLNDTCYAGYHGAWKKPARFPGGWKGDKERVAGGFFFATPEFYAETAEARTKYYGLLKDGKVGTYREEDEVVLCNILKESGLPVIQSKYFPLPLRGIHLGDFKPSMDHRWKNKMRMGNKIASVSMLKYRELMLDEGYREILEIVRSNNKINQVFNNLEEFING